MTQAFFRTIWKSINLNLLSARDIRAHDGDKLFTYIKYSLVAVYQPFGQMFKLFFFRQHINKQVRDRCENSLIKVYFYFSRWEREKNLPSRYLVMSISSTLNTLLCWYVLLKSSEGKKSRRERRNRFQIRLSTYLFYLFSMHRRFKLALKRFRHIEKRFHVLHPV